jgi:hypothetical protein
MFGMPLFILLYRSFHVQVPFLVISEETHKCPVGKVPNSHVFSSSNQSLLSKACLFSEKGFTSEISASYRGVMRQVGAWRILKNKWALSSSYGNYVVWANARNVVQLVSHRRSDYLKPYLGASCKEHNTYIKVWSYYEVQASKIQAP